MRKTTLALAAVAAVLSSAPAWAATTLVSEDFTSGLGVFVPTGQVGINTGNGYVPCCSTTGSPANMSDPFVAFGSNNQPSGTISTTTSFTLTPGETYTLTFDFAALGNVQLSDPISGTVGGHTFFVNPITNNNMDTNFTTITFTIPGDGLSGPLSFTSAGTNDVDAIIDNVVFTTSENLVTAVPEPAAWAMMLLGFAGIGMAARKRRPAAALA